MKSLISVEELYHNSVIHGELGKLNKKIENQKKIYDNNTNHLHILINRFYGFKPNKIITMNDLLSDKDMRPNITRPKNKSLYKWILMHKKMHDELADERRIYWNMHRKFAKENNVIVKKLNKIEKTLYGTDKQTFIEFSETYQIEKYSNKPKNPTIGETRVMNFLSHVSKKYKLIYFFRYKWSFCRNILPLEYDFYCVLEHSNRFIHFVIEFDGDQHMKDLNFFDYEKNHQLDIMKQHYLFEMNIPLLRVNNKHDVEKIIIEFINEIFISDTYVGINLLEPTKKLFECTEKCKGLLFFNEHCNKLYNNSYFQYGLKSQHNLKKFKNTDLISVDSFIIKNNDSDKKILSDNVNDSIEMDFANYDFIHSFKINNPQNFTFFKILTDYNKVIFDRIHDENINNEIVDYSD